MEDERRWRTEYWPTVLGAAFICLICVAMNWSLAKMLVGQAMEALGISWTNPDQVSDGDKLEFVASTLLGLGGVFLAWLAYRIDDTQHRLLLEQRAQKARPIIYWQMLGDTSGDYDYHGLYIANAGERTLREYDWTILFPDDWKNDVSIDIDGGVMTSGNMAIDDAPNADEPLPLYVEYEGHLKVPVWPKRHKRLGQVVVKAGAGKGLSLQWSVTCEDGTFPSTGIGLAKAIYGDDPIE
jgi:hypothetical protein